MSAMYLVAWAVAVLALVSVWKQSKRQPAGGGGAMTAPPVEQGSLFGEGEV